MNAHDLCAGLFVGQRELNLPIETAGTEQGGIEDVDTIRCSQNLDAIIGGETIQLVEELQHSSLHLPVAGLLRVKTLCADGIQLVDEDD